MDQLSFITEIANPAAVGFRWKDDDAAYELAWPRDTTFLLFAISLEDGKWSTPFRMAERWDLPEPTIAAARARVREFLAEAA
jgi:hypothetical protein